jgi:23S rRNA (cytidine1920-2'-O)/16S rRNA (cytidine1409-2'-O)-methyltransferase
VRRRLDVEMVRRGIVASRAEATIAIRSGTVTVAGRPVSKASTLVDQAEPIVMVAPARRFVSRGGDKLDAALDRFGIDPTGKLALDAGSSTGGFTDCLLQRGAARVIAIDVGYGQLDWRLRQDARVVVMERTNIRELDPADLPYPPDLVTADLSFISLRLTLPPLARSSAPVAEFVLLVKPQFEAGRADVGGGGVVSDPPVWGRVVREIAGAARELALEPVGVMASPLLGPAGNAEFLLYAHRRIAVGGGAVAFDEQVEQAVLDASEMVSRRG